MRGVCVHLVLFRQELAKHRVVLDTFQSVSYTHLDVYKRQGLGGLKWDDVKAIIETVSNDYPNVDLYVVETYQSE